MGKNTSIYGVEYSVPITTSDSTVIPVTRAVLLDVAGNLKVTYSTGQSDTLTLAAGMWHPMQVNVIWATGTTATGIHAGY